LVVHESNNDVADVHLADEYRQIYGHAGAKGLPTIERENQGRFSAPEGNGDTDIFIDEDSSSARLSGMTGQSRSFSNGIETAPNSSN